MPNVERPTSRTSIPIVQPEPFGNIQTARQDRSSRALRKPVQTGQPGERKQKPPNHMANNQSYDFIKQHSEEETDTERTVHL